MPDIATTRVFSDGEKGITAQKLNDIIAGSTIQTDFVATKPVASTLDPADNLLVLKSSGTYAQAPFSTVVNSVAGQLPSQDAEIWSVRLRSFNAIGNPNFEVDQRNAGALVTLGATAFIPDRWAGFKTVAAAMAVSAQRQSGFTGLTSFVPGTNFGISSGFLRVILNTPQAAMASGDALYINENIEGPMLRELLGDVHSISLLVRSSVSNLKFSVCLRDPGAQRSLVKLCTIPTANTLTLIQLPNLPVWPPSGGNFSMAPGVAGYSLFIGLAIGGNLIAPAADTWQNGNFIGAPGMSNFAASATNSTFDLCFVQHEPSPVCSTLMDLPFSGVNGNLEACQRYFSKSYSYAVKPGTVDTNGAILVPMPAGLQPGGYIPFKKTMAKTPVILGYSPDTGTSGNVRDINGAVDRAISSYNLGNDSSFGGVVLTSPNAGATNYRYHYTADTGW